MAIEDISAEERAMLYGFDKAARDYGQPEWAAGMLKITECYQSWLSYEIFLDSLIKHQPWYQINAREGAQRLGFII